MRHSVYRACTLTWGTVPHTIKKWLYHNQPSILLLLFRTLLISLNDHNTVFSSFPVSYPSIVIKGHNYSVPKTTQLQYALGEILRCAIFCGELIDQWSIYHARQGTGSTLRSELLEHDKRNLRSPRQGPWNNVRSFYYTETSRDVYLWTAWVGVFTCHCSLKLFLVFCSLRPFPRVSSFFLF